MIHKKIIFAFILCCPIAVFASSENYDNDILLNEIIMDKFSEFGYGDNFQFWGDGNLHTVFMNQNISANNDSCLMAYEGSIYLRYTNKLDGMAFGVETRTRQKSGLLKNGNPIFETMYAFLETDRAGEFRAGFINTAADQLCIAGHQVLTAYEGPGSGNFEAFYSTSAGAIVDTGYTFDDSQAAKIVWYSPIIHGFSVASSFTFNGRYTNPFVSKHWDTNCKSDHSWDFAHTSAHSKNVLTVAGKYEYGSQNDFNTKISAVGWIGQGESGQKDIKIRNVRAYQIGIILGFKNFKIAAGFTNNGKSLLSKKYATREIDAFDNNRPYDITDADVGIRAGANAGKIYNIGTSYVFDKLTLSAGYYRSIVKFSKNNNERAVANIITVGAEYKFNRTLSAYIEYDNIVTSTCARAMAYKKACGLPYNGANRANIVIIGTKINF